MNSFSVVINQAIINYNDTITGEKKKSVSNSVYTIIYIPKLLLTSYCTKKYKAVCNCNCYCNYYCYYTNSFCIYNYSLNFLENVYIRINLPHYLKYVNKSLTASNGRVNDSNKLEIFIKEVHPMQEIYINFCTYKSRNKACMNKEILRLSTQCYIMSNDKKIYFNKEIILINKNEYRAQIYTFFS